MPTKYSKQYYLNRREASHQYYQEHKVSILSRTLANSARRKERNRLIVQGYLVDHPCIDCGEADLDCLDFDHVRGKKKDGISNLAGTGRPVETLMNEIKKCVVRCANCHRKRHAQERRSSQQLS